MSVWPLALGLSVLGSAGGLLLAAVILVFSHETRARIVPWLISYAVGTLLGVALLGLASESLDTLKPPVAFTTLLAGILTFFVLEKLALWRHCHEDHECAVHPATASLVIFGHAIHTFVDGIVIAAATLISAPLGVNTAVAILAHEIPQQAGDFAILLGAGYSRSRALLLNLSSGIGGILGAATMLVFGSQAPALVPYVLAFAAGNFMYVAMADLIPTLHRGHLDKNAFRQIGLMALGVLTIALL